MVQTLERGFFTFEKNIQGYNLFELEERLGFEKGRLKQGADFYLLNKPHSTDYFDVFGTTETAEHRFPKDAFQQQNQPTQKDLHLQRFQYERLIKVVPLKIHIEAARQHLTESEYQVLKDIKFGTYDDIQRVWEEKFQFDTNSLGKLARMFKLGYDTMRRDDLNDKLYPPAKVGGIEQWKMKYPIMASRICRLVSYTKARYGLIEVISK
jgi:hypothetical protein